jgi:hypothetical protein
MHTAGGARSCREIDPRAFSDESRGEELSVDVAIPLQGLRIELGNAFAVIAAQQDIGITPHQPIPGSTNHSKLTRSFIVYPPPGLPT